MLRIPGAAHRYCDGFSRRSFLQIGGLALGGLSLPRILEAESSASSGGLASAKRSHKACIMIYLPRGPRTQPMSCRTPDTPREFRG